MNKLDFRSQPSINEDEYRDGWLAALSAEKAEQEVEAPDPILSDVFEAIAPGREFTANDVKNRMKLKVSEDVMMSALRRLLFQKKIVAESIAAERGFNHTRAYRRK